MKKTFYLLLFILFTRMVSAQDCACRTENHKAFNFWVGEWEVKDTLGRVVGENSIQLLEDNCILSENWKGASGGSGKSYNYYDKTDSTWNQLWLDNKGNQLKLKGKAHPGKLILSDKAQNGKIYNQITWTKISDDEVIQLWEAFYQNGKRVSIVFKGIYTRKP